MDIDVNAKTVNVLEICKIDNILHISASVFSKEALDGKKSAAIQPRTNWPKCETSKQIDLSTYPPQVKKRVRYWLQLLQIIVIRFGVPEAHQDFPQVEIRINVHKAETRQLSKEPFRSAEDSRVTPR